MALRFRFAFQLFCLVCISFTMVQCGGNVTKKSLKQGEKLKGSIEDFEKNRQKFSSSVIASISEATEEIQKEDADLPDIARDWEKEWKSIMKRYGKMQDDFEDVGKNSENYFTQLDELTNQLNSEKLKASETEKNIALRKRWDEMYQEASASIEKVQEVLRDGNDFHIVLVTSSMRQKIESNVNELENIASRAQSLLAELEEFSREGKKMVDG